MQTEARIAIGAPPEQPDPTSVRDAADAYRASVTRSLVAARRHDQLMHRLHAVESARALLRLLFALEGRALPAVDDLADALAEVEAAQDWPAGYLRFVLLQLLRDPAPRRQTELAGRVERLLSSRRVPRDLRAGPDVRSVLE